MCEVKIMETMEKVAQHIREDKYQMDMLQGEICKLEEKLAKLDYAKRKQAQLVHQFLSKQHHQTAKYRQVQEVSIHMRFMNRHSTRMLDLLHGSRSQHTEHQLQQATQSIESEMYHTEEEIEQLKRLMAYLDACIQRLYVEQRNLINQ